MYVCANATTLQIPCTCYLVIKRILSYLILCMCVCMFVCVRVCACARVRVCACARVRVCTYVRMYTCMYVRRDVLNTMLRNCCHNRHKQHVNQELDGQPTLKELNKAVSSTAHGKTTGNIGISPEVIKCGKPVPLSA